MTKADLDFDRDVKRIIEEVEDYDFDDQNVNIEDILRENDDEAQTPPLTYSSTTKQTPNSIIQNGRQYPDKDIHPLQLVETRERDINSKLGNQIDLDSKFLLSNYRATFDPNYSSIAYKPSETITKYCFLDQKSMTVMGVGEYFGAPKCIAVLPPKFIAIGTSHATALVYDYGQTGFQKFGTNREQEYGAVTAIDLSKDDALACGYESGHITIWGIPKTELLKTIAPVEKATILSLKFWKDIKNNLVASDDKGFIYLYRIDSMLFQWVVERKVLIGPQNQQKSNQDEETHPLEQLPPVFFTIHVLKRELTDGSTLGKYSLVTLVSMRVVLLVALEPVICKIFKYERPVGIPALNVPCVTWGKGGIPGDDENKDPLLAISWGHSVDLFRFQNIEEENAKGIQYVATYRSPNEVFHIEWISEGNILVYDKKREFKLLYTSFFRPRGNVLPLQEYDESKAATTLHITDPDVGFHIYHNTEDSNDKLQKPIIFYTNTIVGCPSVRRIFVLGFKKLYVAKHLDWKEHLEGLKTKTEWLSALAYCITLYRGEDRKFACLPSSEILRKELIKPYSSELIRDYITSISKVSGTPDPNSSNDIWKTTMLTAIDFLVSMENFEFLFIEVKRLFEAWDMREDFLEALEAFILRNRIEFIPNEPFRDLVKHYTKKQKIDVLQYLVINLSLGDIDVDYVITLCMEYNLLTALMYLCSHREDTEGPDFLTPIARALSIYQRHVEEGNSNQEEYGLRFLWFLDMTLRGRMFPHGEIPDHIWRAKVKDIIILLFEENHLNLMLQIDPHISFEILHLLFEPGLTEVLEECISGSIQLIDDVTDGLRANQKRIANQLRKALEAFSETIKNSLQAQMLALIYYCAKKKPNCLNMLYYMLASLSVHLGYQIPYSIMEESLVYILKEPQDIPSWENKKIGEEDQNPNEERNFIILELLKQLEGRLIPEKAAEIKRLVEESDFIDVKAYLLGLDHEYKKCFDLYLLQGSDLQKVRIFRWLETIIPTLKAKQPEDFKVIKESLLYRLKDLVALNSDKTRKIIVGLDTDLEVQAIKKLEAFPKLQFDYLRGVLSYREDGTNVPDTLLVLYIKLMCQINPKQVIKEVKSYTYPLDECMKICREHDIQDALAFFLERAGNLAEALNLMLGLFRKSLEKNLKKIEKTGTFKENGGLLQKLNNAKEVCIKHNKFQDPDSEGLWFSVLDSVVNCHRDYIANNKSIQDALVQVDDSPQSKAYRKLVKAFSNYISNLFDDMSKYITVESILTKLESINLKLGDLKAPIIGMLETHFYESNILSDARALVVGHNFDTLTEVTNSIMLGVSLKKTNVDEDPANKLVLFNCGHIFPRNCVQGTLCTTCFDRENLKVQAVIMNARKGGAVLRSKGPSGGGSSGNTEKQEALIQDRNRVDNAIKNGTLFKTPGFNRERYLRKLDIYEDFKTVDQLDWNNETLTTFNYANFCVSKQAE